MKGLASRINTNTPYVCEWSVASETGPVLWAHVMFWCCDCVPNSMNPTIVWFGKNWDTKVLNTRHWFGFKNSLCWRKCIKSSVALKGSTNSAYILCSSWILKVLNKVLASTIHIGQVLKWLIYSLLLLFKIFSCVNSLFYSVHFIIFFAYMVLYLNVVIWMHGRRRTLV